MEKRNIFKEIVLSFAITIFTGAFIICVIAGLFLFLTDREMGTPPLDSYYKESLEYITQEKLPSCKVVRKKYREGYRNAAIIRLDTTDYSKLLKAVQSDVFCRTDPMLSFFNFTDDLLQMEGINERLITLRYSGYFDMGFKSPDIVIFQEELQH